MKSLQMNPETYEYTLHDLSDPGSTYAHKVAVKFGGLEGDVYFTSKEAKRVGEWFLVLAKDMEKSK